MHAELIGKRITDIRHKKGLTQKELALKIRLDRSYLCNIENGKRIFIFIT